jgi:hypothetical protein
VIPPSSCLHIVRVKTITEEVDWSRLPEAGKVKWRNCVSVLVPAVDAWRYRVATAMIERRN